MERKFRHRIAGWTALLGLFLFVVGARWEAVRRFGMDLPTWDQWDAEGVNLLGPWLNHHLSVAALFLPQNEHRVVLTKVLALFLTWANGQWDQRVECLFNALLPAAIAGGFFFVGCRRLGRRWLPPLMIFLMAVFGLPLGWENIVRGFDSQQFLLIGLSCAAIALLPAARPWSVPFWLGAAAALLALGTMATGFFSAIVVAGLSLLLRRRQTRSWRQIGPVLVLSFLLIAAGLALKVDFPMHHPLHARNLRDFWLSVRHSLVWPGYDPAWSWMALINWIPWLGLAWTVIHSPRVRLTGFNLALVGWGGWVLLQILATAYARGAGAPNPAPRYLDTLVIGVALNALSLVWLWEEGGWRGWPREALAVTGIAWVILLALNLITDTSVTWNAYLPHEKIDEFYCEQNTRNYLATGDEHYLHHSEIPYPSATALAARMQYPGLISLLPASVRRPIGLDARSGAGFLRYDSRATERENLRRGLGVTRRPTGFSPETPPIPNRVTWGSYGGLGAGGAGDWSSRTLPAGRGWLKFETAGEVGGSGLSLELLDAATGATIAKVTPDKIPGNSWRSAYVAIPARSYRIHARDDSRSGWFAFSEPVEMGPLSYWSWRLSKQAILMGTVGGVLALLSLVPLSFRPSLPGRKEK